MAPFVRSIRRVSGPVIVVGAGIAGLACARALHEAGVPVQVRERARVAGGRLATRRYDGRPADIGAAYFTVTDAGFGAQVAGWRGRGLARPWTDTLAVHAPDGWSRTTGPMRWAAPGGLRGLVGDLAEGLDVRCERPVHRVAPGPLVDGEPAAAVVLAMPDPQAARLLDPGLIAASAAVAGRAWAPVLALTARYAERRWQRLSAAFVNDHPVLALIADDGDRRGDGAPVLVAHSTGGFAAPRLADPAAAAELVAAVEELLGPLGEPIGTHVHRWSFARPAGPRAAATADERYHLDGDRIGLAGDGWGPPKVQTAWQSGTRLGRAIAAELSRS